MKIPRMKYKFISRETKEEIPHVWIDGFVYLYDPNADCLENSLVIFTSTTNDHITKYNTPRRAKWDYGANGLYNLLVIGTNNPLLTDIPQIQLEEDVEKLAHNVISLSSEINGDREYLVAFTCFCEGYNQCQETYPWTDEDMIEFAEFRVRYLGQTQEFEELTKTTKQILDIWKEQRIKIIEV